MKKVKIKKGSKFVEEFKTFILRGNVMDLAVGVLIGAAFQELVTSLTDNIISPILGCFSEVDFNQFSLNIGKLHLTYGAFITDVINFIIMAFVIFMIVKFMNFIESLGHKKEEEKKEVPSKSEETKLLEEIRDLLKKQNK
ncbi:MAG: large conductance mechanosensitive channel protein MscL [Erysipelotrichales bacterium]|nr:large conductance mechanosensitive channel protein MscL [Erysipelotrichales bacterium]